MTRFHVQSLYYLRAIYVFQRVISKQLSSQTNTNNVGCTDTMLLLYQTDTLNIM